MERGRIFRAVWSTTLGWRSRCQDSALGFRATVLLDISTLSASLIATPARTLTPSVQLMALGLHIPPVRATCERPRMVVMVAQDLLGRKGTGLPRQSWPQTLSDRRVPKIVGDSEGRKTVPSFAR